MRCERGQDGTQTSSLSSSPTPPRSAVDSRALLWVIVVIAVLPETLFLGIRVFASDAGLSLLAVCMAAALGTVGYAAYREQVLTVRRVVALRDEKKRDEVVIAMRKRVQRAQLRRDLRMLEDAVRDSLEALLLAGCWDEVRWFVARAEPIGRPTFLRWLMGVAAPAALREGEHEQAADALREVGLEGPWLQSIDALRLALIGEGEEALQRLGEAPPRLSPAVDHQRWLARVHALASIGKRDEAMMLLASRMDALTAVLLPEGPASSLALGLMHGQGGPFRAPH